MELKEFREKFVVEYLKLIEDQSQYVLFKKKMISIIESNGSTPTPIAEEKINVTDAKNLKNVQVLHAAVAKEGKSALDDDINLDFNPDKDGPQMKAGNKQFVDILDEDDEFNIEGGNPDSDDEEGFLKEIDNAGKNNKNRISGFGSDLGMDDNSGFDFPPKKLKQGGNPVPKKDSFDDGSSDIDKDDDNGDADFDMNVDEGVDNDNRQGFGDFDVDNEGSFDGFGFNPEIDRKNQILMEQESARIKEQEILRRKQQQQELLDEKKKLEEAELNRKKLEEAEKVRKQKEKEDQEKKLQAD